VQETRIGKDISGVELGIWGYYPVSSSDRRELHRGGEGLGILQRGVSMGKERCHAGKLPFGEDVGDNSSTKIRKRQHELASRAGAIILRACRSVKIFREQIWNKID
jgi:hypothetical protein